MVYYCNSPYQKRTLLSSIQTCIVHSVPTSFSCNIFLQLDCLNVSLHSNNVNKDHYVIRQELCIGRLKPVSVTAESSNACTIIIAPTRSVPSGWMLLRSQVSSLVSSHVHVLSHRTCSGQELLLHFPLHLLIERAGVFLLCLDGMTMFGAGATVALLSVEED